MGLDHSRYVPAGGRLHRLAKGTVEEEAMGMGPVEIDDAAVLDFVPNQGFSIYALNGDKHSVFFNTNFLQRLVETGFEKPEEEHWVKKLVLDGIYKRSFDAREFERLGSMGMPDNFLPQRARLGHVRGGFIWRMIKRVPPFARNESRYENLRRVLKAALVPCITYMDVGTSVSSAVMQLSSVKPSRVWPILQSFANVCRGLQVLQRAEYCHVRLSPSVFAAKVVGRQMTLRLTAFNDVCTEEKAARKFVRNQELVVTSAGIAFEALRKLQLYLPTTIAILESFTFKEPPVELVTALVSKIGHGDVLEAMEKRFAQVQQNLQQKCFVTERVLKRAEGLMGWDARLESTSAGGCTACIQAALNMFHSRARYQMYVWLKKWMHRIVKTKAYSSSSDFWLSCKRDVVDSYMLHKFAHTVIATLLFYHENARLLPRRSAQGIADAIVLLSHRVLTDQGGGKWDKTWSTLAEGFERGIPDVSRAWATDTAGLNCSKPSAGGGGGAGAAAGSSGDLYRIPFSPMLHGPR
jgi:hypothetical protein